MVGRRWVILKARLSLRIRLLCIDRRARIRANIRIAYDRCFGGFLHFARFRLKPVGYCLCAPADGIGLPQPLKKGMPREGQA